MNVSSSPEAGRRVSLGARSEASLLGFDRDDAQQTNMQVEEKEMNTACRSMNSVCQIKVNCCSLIDLDTFLLGMWHGHRQRSARLQPPRIQKEGKLHNPHSLPPPLAATLRHAMATLVVQGSRREEARQMDRIPKRN